MKRSGSDPPAGVTPPGRADVGLPDGLTVRLLALLAAAAGCLDVLCVVRLGGAFASVITGNLVQLGRGAATPDVRLLMAATAAVGGYAVGVAAGTAILGRRGAGWYRRTSVVAAVEVALLICVAAAWWATEGRPGPGTADALLALAGAAMGVQSAITLSSGVREASTTCMTGTLTSVVRTLTTGPHRLVGIFGGIVRLTALLCGAAIGALVLRIAPLWAPVLPAALVGGVAVTAAAYGALLRSR
ncbi:YoaK family protein [Streptomyces sp. F001]|uniref:YoaK family protein n=1 Tax=Streptomyces sp. F001 TaxID=1510026 RepID=UPI0013EED1C0|nr:YoaK family protein [Streptomyces sp. F001]